MNTRRWLIGAVVWTLTSLSVLHAADVTIQIELNGRRIEGMPIAWNESAVELLGRDGRVWRFARMMPNARGESRIVLSAIAPVKCAANCRMNLEPALKYQVPVTF